VQDKTNENDLHKFIDACNVFALCVTNHLLLPFHNIDCSIRSDISLDNFLWFEGPDFQF